MPLQFADRTDRIRYIPLALGAMLAAYLAVSAAGPAGLAVVLAAAGFAAALVLWTRREAPTVDAALIGRLATGGVLLVPALITVGLSLSGGGFFPDSIAWAVIALAVILIVRCALAPSPLQGIGPWVLVPGLALVALAIWTLLSGLWSDAPGRALLEFERVALYGLAFLLFGSLGRSSRRLSFAVCAIAAALTLVAALALLSRAAPDVLPTSPSFRADRLSFPLGYWNALGLSCAIGLVFALHLSASEREAKIVRVLAAGALPLIATTLLLTYSRAGVAAAVLGVVIYVLAAHPRGLILAVLAAGPATAFSLRKAYDATLLSSDTPTSAAAVAQGHEVGWVVIVCVAAAVVLRAVLLLVDARLDRIRLPARARRPVRGGAWVALIVAVAVVAVAVDAPGEARARYQEFVEVSSPNRDVTRERLVNASNAGRLALWRAALDGFEENRLLGTGAGTYGELWMQYRSTNSFSSNAHGLYQEVLAELGIVGLALLLVALVPILVGLAPFRRGPDRCVYAALFAAALITAGHGAFDWDWEMPATQLWLFALGGLALARASDSLPRPRPRAARGIGLAAIGLVALGLAGLSGAVLASQTRLDASVDAYHDENCRTSLAEARSAMEILPSRSEPREVVGACLAQTGRNGEAATALQGALDRDPRNWGLHYSLAAVLAARNRDPRPQLREARRLNPSLTRDATGVAELGARSRATRRRSGRAIAARLPLSGRW